MHYVSSVSYPTHRVQSLE